MAEEQMAWFLCGCCGNDFKDLPSVQRKHDQDEGYGFCPNCEKYMQEKAERDWQTLEDKVSTALNEQNREKFLSYEKEVRRGLLLKMIEDGIITWGPAK